MTFDYEITEKQVYLLVRRLLRRLEHVHDQAAHLALGVPAEETRMIITMIVTPHPFTNHTVSLAMMH